jgi:hypothetical protein
MHRLPASAHLLALGMGKALRVLAIVKKPSLRQMTTSTLALIVLVILLVGLLPTWPYSRGWGYYPSGALGAILLIVFLLLLFGRI